MDRDDVESDVVRQHQQPHFPQRPDNRPSSLSRFNPVTPATDRASSPRRQLSSRRYRTTFGTGFCQIAIAKTGSISCQTKSAMVLRSFTRDTSTWSIAKNSTLAYLVRRQSQHTIYCAVGPKSFSAVMVRKTTAQSERHQKQCISGASRGIFPGCRLEDP